MRTASKFLLLFLGFFALYALTAQRGVAWGDSAEFQQWILHETAFVCGPQFSNAHPFYVAFARLVAPTPFAVTLVSAFFGALAVGGLFLCTRRVALAALFGLSQMLWWLSTLAEVQTMSLAFTAFETACLLRALGDGDDGKGGGAVVSPRARLAWLSLAALLAGAHLGVHNFALLALPVYAAILGALVVRRELRLGAAALVVLSWCAGAGVWLYYFATRGPLDVLVGSYGAKVAGVWPTNCAETAFNFALAALSFFVPCALVWWARATWRLERTWVAALFAINALFFVRYFVPDQSQFLLPTLFFAYVLLRRVEVRPSRAVALALMQVVLPVLLYSLAVQLPAPEERKARHPGRDDARYFILPWKGAFP